MTKIGILCNDNAQKKEIKSILNQYFEDLQIEAEITSLRTKMTVLRDIAAGS